MSFVFDGLVRQILDLPSSLGQLFRVLKIPLNDYEDKLLTSGSSPIHNPSASSAADDKKISSSPEDSYKEPTEEVWKEMKVLKKGTPFSNKNWTEEVLKILKNSPLGTPEWLGDLKTEIEKKYNNNQPLSEVTYNGKGMTDVHGGLFEYGQWLKMLSEIISPEFARRHG